MAITTRTIFPGYKWWRHPKGKFTRGRSIYFVAVYSRTQQPASSPTFPDVPRHSEQHQDTFPDILNNIQTKHPATFTGIPNNIRTSASMVDKQPTPLTDVHQATRPTTRNQRLPPHGSSL